MGTDKKQKEIKELFHCNKYNIKIFNQVINDLMISKKEQLINFHYVTFLFVVIFVVSNTPPVRLFQKAIVFSV